MKVEIYTVVKNTGMLFPFFIEHYRKMFPECIINVHDNGSTDDTVKICKEYGCNVEFFEKECSHKNLTDFKNNIWKSSEADWIVICDQDELVHVTEEDLIREDDRGVTMLRFMGYNMISLNGDDFTLDELTHGTECPSYSKFYMFKPNRVKEINYSTGSHFCNPEPFQIMGDVYKALHYKLANMTRSNMQKSFNTKGIAESIDELFKLNEAKAIQVINAKVG